MTQQNMKIWDAGSKSDTKAVKKGAGNNGNSSINSYYMFEKATEIFGAVGFGWGYDIVEERIDDGKPVTTPEGVMLEKNHTIRLRLWHGNREQYVEQYGHTKQLYWSNAKKYWIYDDEAPKKSVTDAVKKCLSMLGIYADVFKGMVEDIEYMAEKQAIEQLEKSDNKQDEIDRQLSEMREYVKGQKEFFDAATNMSTINGIMRKTDNKLISLGRIPGMFESSEAARAAIAKKYHEIKTKLEASDGSAI